MINRKVSLLTVCLLIFAVAFSVRVAYVLGTHTYLNMQSGCEMQQAARGFAYDGDMVNVFGHGTGKSAHVAPLYPWALAQMYRLLGYHTPLQGLVQQLLASLATAIAIGLLPFVARSGGLNTISGAVAGGALAVCPFNLWIETSGTWEQPYAALGLVLLFLSFCSLRSRGWQDGRLTLLTGGLLGVCVLLSPNLLLAALLILAAEWGLQTGRRTRVFVSGTIILALVVAFVSPWMIRNYHALGGLVPIRSNFGLELWVGNNPAATGQTFGEDGNAAALKQLHPYSNDAEREHYQDVGELAYMHEKQQLATNWIAAHPLRFCWLTARRFQLYWLPTPDTWPPTTGLRAARSLAFSFCGLGALVGLSLLFWRNAPHRWLWLIAIVSPSLMYLVTHIDPRYGYPTLGLSAVVACDLALTILTTVRDRVREWITRYGIRMTRRSVHSFGG